MDRKEREMRAARVRTGKTILLLLFLLIAVMTTAQKVRLKADATTVSPGDPLNISVYSNVKGIISPDFPLEFQTEDGRITSTENIMDHATGKVETNYVLKQRGSFGKKGTYTLYAYVRYKGRSIRSNPLVIKVSDAGSPKDLVVKTSDPVYGQIELSKKSVYEGEAVLVTARMVSSLDIFNLHGYNKYTFANNVETHEFTNMAPAFRKMQIGGKQKLVLDHDKRVIFPVATGQNRVRAFGASLLYHGDYLDKQYNLKSASAILNVKPLPSGAPPGFIGAVGSFGLELSPGKTTIAEGDAYKLVLIVSGRGNLHNITAPTPKLPNGCTVYGDPDRKEDYTYTEEGTTGTITFTYDIKIAGSGSFVFPEQRISWFDPSGGKYEILAVPGFTLNVTPKAGASGNAPQGLKSRSGKAPQAKAENGGTLLWMIAIVGFAAVIIGLVLLMRKKRQPQQAPETVIRPEKTPVADQPKTDLWAEAERVTTDPMEFAAVLPKAIIAEINRKTRKEHLSITEALSELPDEMRSLLSEIIGVCERYRYDPTAGDISPIILLQRARRALGLS
jgi:hypothetical protein